MTGSGTSSTPTSSSRHRSSSSTASARRSSAGSRYRAPVRRNRRARAYLQLRHQPPRAAGDGRDRPGGAHDLLGSELAVPVRLLPGDRRRGDLRGTRLSADARRILAAQAARALAYGLGTVLIGVTLARRGLSDTAVGEIG